MSTTPQEKDGVPLQLDYDWHAFRQALCKNIEGEDWEAMYNSYREMSGAVGGKMKAANDAREEYYNPRVRKASKAETKQNQHFGQSTSKMQFLRWTKPLSAWKITIEGSGPSAGKRCVLQWPPLKLGEKPIWEGVWPYLDAMDTVCVAHNVNEVECARETFEAFNSFIRNGFQVPELKGDSESSDGYQAGNVNNEALHVVGLHGQNLSSCKTGSWQRWHQVVTWPWASCARKCTKWKGDVAGPAEFLLSNFVVMCTPYAFLVRNERQVSNDE